MPYNDKPVNMLSDRVILVTGASRGIGRACALTLAAQGATVILLARKVKDLTSIYDEISEAGYPEPAIYPMNLTQANPDHYKELRENIEKEFGRLDGIFHNAALLGALTPIEHYTVDNWYSVMQTNLHAPFLLTKACLPLLKQSPKANIVFTRCDSQLMRKAYWGAYGISKEAIRTLSDILSEELAETNISVSCFDPGIVKTKLRAEAYPAEDPEMHPGPEVVAPGILALFVVAQT